MTTPEPKTERLERLRAEARYRRDRFRIYRAKVSGGRAASLTKLRELERASEGAAARLRKAESETPPTPPRA